MTKILGHHVTIEQTRTIVAVINTLGSEIKIPQSGIISNGLYPGEPFFDIPHKATGIISSFNVCGYGDANYLEYEIGVKILEREK